MDETIQQQQQQSPAARSVSISDDNTRRVPIREFLQKLAEEKKYTEAKEDTVKSKSFWKWPFWWKWTMNKSVKQRDKVIVFYLNIKGEVEPPVLVPLYSGNMVIIRHKVYEVDPRAFWTVRNKMKMWKVLFIKEIDRRPVSNLDYAEIKARGDATDSDEFLIKAALKAHTTSLFPKGGANILYWIIGIAIVGGLIYFFMR